MDCTVFVLIDKCTKVIIVYSLQTQIIDTFIHNVYVETTKWSNKIFYETLPYWYYSIQELAKLKNYLVIIKSQSNINLLCTS